MSVRLALYVLDVDIIIPGTHNVFMNYSRLLFTILPAVGGILIFAIWSNVHVYAQPSSSPTLSASSPPSTANSPSVT
jgi:hypothetical protein